MKKYIQSSLFGEEKSVSPYPCRCWRCGEYFPFSQIHIFDVMYESGRVGTYQACASCYDLIMANNGVVCSLGDEKHV